MKRIAREKQISKAPDYKAWVLFIDLCDRVLKEQKFEKVVTPYLVSSGAMESNLEPFSLKTNFGAFSKEFHLPTSPEFHIKKALSTGCFNDVFEIKTCFRNEEQSAHHKAEFTMLEFYKKDCDMNEFIHIVLSFINQVYFKLQTELTSYERPLVKLKTEKKAIAVKIVKILDLFKDLEINLNPSSTALDLKVEAKKIGLYYSEYDTFDDLFFRIWLEMIEPRFNKEVLTVVHSYPPSQAALSKIDNEGWAKRFEIYGAGFELGNAFEELSDSRVIAERWAFENNKRVLESKKPHPIDQDFIDSLDDLPDYSGIAIGLERLFMMFYGFSDIKEFNLFDID